MPYGKSNYKIIRVTPAVIAGTTSVDDVMFDSTEIPNAVIGNGGCSELIGIALLDKDNEAHDLDIIFTQNQRNLGTAGDAADVSDSNFAAAKPIGAIDVDWSASKVSVGGLTSVCYFAGHNRSEKSMQLPMLLQASDDSTSIYFSAIAKEEIAFAATDDLTFVFHIKYR